MKKILFLFAVCAYGMFTESASAQYLVKPTFMETQGVSNAGVVSGYVDQGGPYSLWNPEADTSFEIGGAAPGMGVGGAVHFSGDGNLISGTTYETITTDTEWEKLNTGFDYIFWGIEFPGNQSSTGFAAGESLTYNGDGIVIKTTDGGDTWTELWTGEGQGIEAMSFPTQYTGYVGGWGQYFAKTIDGGTTWTTQTPGTDVYIYTGIAFKDGYNGVVTAQTDTDAGVYITSDGGTTWTTGSGLTGVPYHITFVGGNTYFLVTNGGDVQKSTDSGLTWTTVFSGTADLLVGINFYDSMNGIATGESDVYRTTDGGETWVGQQVTEGAIWRDAAWQDADNVTLVGTPELIFSSEDGGATWPNNNLATTTLNEALYDVDFTADGTGYIIGSQGVMFRKESGSSTHSVMSQYNVENDEWTVLGSFNYAVDIAMSQGYNISEDGITNVGSAYVEPTPGASGTAVHACAWTEADGMIDLGSLYTDINRSTRANAVSGDGSVVVGWQDFNGPWKAAVWRKDANGDYLPNEYVLVDPDGDATDEYNQLGQATAISADGNWIGGRGDYANDYAAWIWSEATGAISLPNLAPGSTGSVTGINEDGSIIIGYFQIDPWTPNVPFIYTTNGGMQDLNDFITETLGFTEDASPVWTPNAISTNGKYITGWGLDPNLGQWGETFTFRLQLPSTPANNVVEEAEALSCGDLVTNSTIFGTNTAGNESPDVYYSYTGNGEPQMITLNACGPETNFATTVRVFSDNTLTDQIGFNDSSCENQPEMSFVSDGTSTYIIMVEGYDSSKSGNFQLGLTCETISGVNENHLADVGLYPNPVTDKLNISSQTEITSVTIYNVNGQLLVSKELNATQGEIDLSALAPGIYFAKLVGESATETFKIVKN